MSTKSSNSLQVEDIVLCKIFNYFIYLNEKIAFFDPEFCLYVFLRRMIFFLPLTTISLCLLPVAKLSIATGHASKFTIVLIALDNCKFA